jgi:pimeloyl-ACP methyl ester carboxylesterase
MLRRSIVACLWVLYLVLATGPAPGKDAYFDSNGCKIHYLDQGEGEPVLLIHGFTMNANTQWAPIIRELKDQYRVIAIDNRGHGRSDKPHEPDKYGMEMVLDQVRLLDHLGIEKAHVVGYSMGGFITSKLITTHPDRVKSAVLGGAGWTRENDNGRFSMLSELADSLEAGRGIGPLIKNLTPPGQPIPGDDQIKVMNDMVMLMNDPKALACVIRGMGPGLAITEEQLKANQVPTLALIGGSDPLKEGVDAMEPVCANFDVIVIEGADHMNAPSRPEFIDGLKQFLASHSDAPQAAETEVAEPVGAAN